MQAQALICDQDRSFRLTDVTMPDPGPEDVVIRAKTTGVSIGTEFALITGKLTSGTYPMVTGYQAIGTIEFAGNQVDGFAVGDTVGYRLVFDPKLPDGTPVTTAFGGAHCSHSVCNPNATGVFHLPAGAPEDIGSHFVVAGVGFHGVQMANPLKEETVVVYGAGLIGLSVVAYCYLRGAKVIVVDLDPFRLEVAQKLGADVILQADQKDLDAARAEHAPEGADVVFESTGATPCITQALDWCRPHARFVWQGNYGDKPVPFDFIKAHGKQLQMVFPCGGGGQEAALAVVRHMGSGALPWQHTITHRVKATEAADLYATILRGETSKLLGAIIDWT